MSGKQAKILSGDQINDLLLFSTTTRSAARNRIIALLSVKAGLRAGEIAKLTWDMVLDSARQVGSVIELRDHAARRAAVASFRSIPTFVRRLMSGAVIAPAPVRLFSRNAGAR
jgi:integrase